MNRNPMEVLKSIRDGTYSDPYREYDNYDKMSTPEVREACRKIGATLARMRPFLDGDKVHPTLTRAQMLDRFELKVDELSNLCCGGAGYNDDPNDPEADPWAENCVEIWRFELARYQSSMPAK
jgi:hypothetical protein